MSRVVAEARRWLGTPFHLHARRHGVGVDCIGLVEEVGMALGFLAAQARRDYSLWDRDLVAELDARLDRIDLDAAGPGDVLAFSTDGSGCARHLAIRTDYGIVHTFEDCGRVVETGLSKGWSAKLIGAWRFRGLA